MYVCMYIYICIKCCPPTCLLAFEHHRGRFHIESPEDAQNANDAPKTQQTNGSE